MLNSQMVMPVSANPTLRYFVKLDNGNKITAFSRGDAIKLAAKTGGKVISIPMSR